MIDVMHFFQFAGILILLVFASMRESSTTPGESQLAACSKPLGTWDIFWMIRVFFNCVFYLWRWYRSRIIRLRLVVILLRGRRYMY